MNDHDNIETLGDLRAAVAALEDLSDDTVLVRYSDYIDREEGPILSLGRVTWTEEEQRDSGRQAVTGWLTLQ